MRPTWSSSDPIALLAAKQGNDMQTAYQLQLNLPKTAGSYALPTESGTYMPGAFIRGNTSTSARTPLPEDPLVDKAPVEFYPVVGGRPAPIYLPF